MATISERAISAREARYMARKTRSVQGDGGTREPSRDPWCYAGGPGEYGHPNIDQGTRKASPDLIERAMAAYQFTRPDTRFANSVSRFSRLMC